MNIKLCRVYFYRKILASSLLFNSKTFKLPKFYRLISHDNNEFSVVIRMGFCLSVKVPWVLFTPFRTDSLLAPVQQHLLVLMGEAEKVRWEDTDKMLSVKDVVCRCFPRDQNSQTPRQPSSMRGPPMASLPDRPP